MSGGPDRDLATVLVAWGRVEGRDLPWRRTRDPWAVLVSEVMLQQTQVARVAPRWETWMARWPTPASLAAADLGDVVAAWSGLGYNRRAVALHRCATAVTADHGGQLPGDIAGLEALPGVGPYTARAVLAFAHGRDVGVLDVNASRVLARVGGRRLRAGEAQRLADSLVPTGAAWAYNSAVLDLGATVCTARRPACGRCPVAAASLCSWVGDPAVADPGAPTTRPQTTFEGSDRQGRGRLVAALGSGPVPPARLGTVAGWPDDPARVVRVVAGLVADGLARRAGDGGIARPTAVTAVPAGVPCGADHRGVRESM